VATGSRLLYSERKVETLARSQFSFEKRRKELDKKKKKEAKREARAVRKAEGDPGGIPMVQLDEWGNPIIEEEATEDAAPEGRGENETEDEKKED
jgi:hypothetical protein